MFRFLDATTADERMAELERFIEWWYGPRKPEYGTPLDELYDLPAPLRRFYAFAGRWPSPDPSDGTEFYCAGGGHYLLPPNRTKGRPDRKLRFFREYQGDWVGLTEHTGDDPPVWFEGYWDDEPDEEGADERPVKTRMASDSLSKFLVTHVLNVSMEHGLAKKGNVAVGAPVWSHTYEDYPGFWGDFFVSGDDMIRQTDPGEMDVAGRPR